MYSCLLYTIIMTMYVYRQSVSNLECIRTKGKENNSWQSFKGEENYRAREKMHEGRKLGRECDSPYLLGPGSCSQGRYGFSNAQSTAPMTTSQRRPSKVDCTELNKAQVAQWPLQITNQPGLRTIE